MKKVKDIPLAPARAPAGTGKATELQELESWIAQGRLPEVIPTQQARSLKTAMAMIEAAQFLLHDHTLEELSVEMVCKRAGTTVGSFYGRFGNKHAFFVTMQRMQTIRSEAALTSFAQRHEKGRSSLDDLCRDMVAYTVNVFRSNLGVLRASLQHTREGFYDIHKAAGERNRPVFTAKFLPHLRHLPAKEGKLRVEFAYQAVAGTLVHSALNEPGPLQIGDDKLIEELVRMVSAYLKSPP